MNRFFFFLLSLLWAASASGQALAGARAAALAGSAVTLSDTWSGFHNQAGLAFGGGLRAGVFYQSRYMVPELGDKGLAIAHPLGSGALGITFRSFGYSLYSDSRAGLAYAIRLDEKLAIGVQANYHHIRIAEGYGTQQTWTVEGGVLYRMNEKLSLGAHLFNPSRAPLADYRDERIPGALRAGAAYAFSDKVRLLGELRVASDMPEVISGGIEYAPVPEFILRAGASSNPASTTFGFGWKPGAWRVDAAAAYHAVLGFSPQISLVFEGNGRDQKVSPAPLP